MIDTDKYEGHLPFTGDELVWVWSKSGMNRMKSVKQFNVTAQLLQDAPLLLEEVKRLRKQLDAATLRASLAIECHPNADDMLQELIE
tara:strand:+ start:394 stop:654 length:261 start_codon:yes stop_codon:yes gene_type:complete